MIYIMNVLRQVSEFLPYLTGDGVRPPLDEEEPPGDVYLGHVVHAGLDSPRQVLQLLLEV